MQRTSRSTPQTVTDPSTERDARITSNNSTPLHQKNDNKVFTGTQGLCVSNALKIIAKNVIKDNKFRPREIDALSDDQREEGYKKPLHNLIISYQIQYLKQQIKKRQNNFKGFSKKKQKNIINMFFDQVTSNNTSTLIKHEKTNKFKALWHNNEADNNQQIAPIVNSDNGSFELPEWIIDYCNIYDEIISKININELENILKADIPPSKSKNSRKKKRAKIKKEEKKKAEKLEETQTHAITGLQSCYRRHKAQKQFKKIQQASIILQSFIRAYQAKAQFQKQKITSTAQDNIADIKERFNKSQEDLYQMLYINTHLVNTLKALNEREISPDLYINPHDLKELDKLLSNLNETAEPVFLKLFTDLGLDNIGINGKKAKITTSEPQIYAYQG